MAGKAAKRLVVVPPRKRVGAYVLGAVRAPFIKILQYRKADWPDRLSFLGVVEAERAAGAVNFGPSNFDDLAEIGRAHVCTPVTNAHLVCRLLLEQKKVKHPHKYEYTKQESHTI